MAARHRRMSMTNKSAAKKPGSSKKLTLKKETLSDLSPKEGTAALVRGETIRIGTERNNHNESLVRDTAAPDR
jgi:hypothetical protein